MASSGSVLAPVLVLCLLALGGYGAYYGYCRYQVAEKQHAFSQAAADLRQALMRLRHKVGQEHVRQVVLGFAEQAGVAADPGEIEVSIEPLTANTMGRLSSVDQTALGIAGRLKNHRLPSWVVGFRASLLAEHGVAKARFAAERFTWLDRSLVVPTR